ncbi:MULTISPECIES: organic hydroperoxide resistance protein [Rhizobium]|uniref:organic hydroperoxide resistance protein n=1 Tax=Rhizobium TaxID=379 RepID=UPI001B318A49|nr:MULTISPECIES: organic hydroperoxide resistance protein [Rhizobium]MBX4906073.1 organic hydroperoxide resistance protein [Rhizobium bangladeshense]MBX5243198.1 organic hydroperoxide resistance protein [Rhizobium sp. NLR3b]MBX5249000.1 organic hydroperoxide resistance protein [Rhizobium sp. NLR4b]MBX5255660.1 organic hydroperoxide resistance protein [Rhizobium sp. NLR16b]MBX5261754.1 organic hydroperoxide resistance protein [Rhizobium sp. NLR16a]
MSKVIYTGTTNTTGGRDGASRTSDGRLDVKLSPPGSSAPGTNPEQLFAAAWSACFLGAIGRAAAERQLRIPADAAVNAEIDLVSNDDGGYVLQARLNAKLPGIETDIAKSLVERAHQLCPYSKATRGNIAVELTAA